MPMKWQYLPIPLGEGVDTKSDDKALAPPKLAVLENGVFDERVAIKKRNGYTQLSGDSNIVISGAPFPGPDSGRQLAARNSDLVLFTEAGAWSHVSSRDEWAAQGTARSVKVERETIAKSQNEQTFADIGEVAGIAIAAWEDSRGGIYAHCWEPETGAVLRTGVQLSSTGIQPRVVPINGWLVVFWVETSGTEIKALPVSPHNAWEDLGGTAVQLVSDMRATSSFYDVEPIGDAAAIAYADTSNEIKVGYVLNNGTLGGNPTWAAPITIAEDPEFALALKPEETTGRIIIVWANSTNGLKGDVRDRDLSQLYTNQLDSGATSGVQNITLAYQPPSSASNVFADIFYEISAAATYNHLVKHCTYSTDGGTSTDTTWMRHCGLAAKAFVDNELVFVPTVHDSTLQATYFVVQAFTAGTTSHNPIAARILPGVAAGLVTVAHLPSVLSSGRRHSWAGGFKTRLQSDAGDVYTELGLKRITLDFDAEDSHQVVQVGDTLYMAGGYVHQLDGGQPSEANFHLYPENVTAAGAVGSGSLVATKTYSYRIYWEVKTNAGERILSTTAEIVSVTLGGSDNEVDLTIPTLAHTSHRSELSRGEVHLAIYRTEEDPGEGALFYRVTDLASPTENDPTADTVSFTDQMSDADLITKELDYQNTGEQDNVAPPAAHLMCAGKGRIFLAGLDDPNVVTYSKPRRVGELVAFHDTNQIVLDQVGGAITALAVLDEKLVIFKRNQIYAVVGDGPNALGYGVFTEPQLVAADIGCINQRTVVLSPMGLVFQSAKGFYLLDRNLQPSYVGADVEAYNDQSFSAGTLRPEQNQIVWVARSGTTLMWDYLFQRWATWTSHTGVGAVIAGGAYYYARSDGSVWQETEGYYRDGTEPFSLVMETAWIKPAGPLQGWSRVRRAIVVGEFFVDKVRVSVSSSYEGGATQVVTFDPTTGLSQNVYGGTSPYGGDTVYGGAQPSERVPQFRFRLRRQKCQAVKFRLEDIPESADQYEITELGLEVGIKKGLARLPAAKTL